MSKTWKVLVVVAAAAFVALLIHSTVQQTKFRYEVCVEFNGRTHCATAEGRSADEAVQSAKTIDCTLLANGRDENIQCLDRQPTSVREIPAK